MKLKEYFKYFLTNTVNLNQSRIDLLDQRVGSIETFLKSENGFGSAAEDLVAQGSYAQRTIIKPVGNHEFDADVLLLMTEQDGWEAKDYVVELCRKFNTSSTYKDISSRQSRCVLINYANEFHVDVVPYLVRNGGHYITNRVTNQFEQTNPEGFNEWLDERDRIAKRRLVEVIRLLKYVRDFKQTFTVRSVVLSFLLAEQVSEWQTTLDPKYYADLPTAFVHLLADLDSWLQSRPTLPYLPDPSCSAQNFHDRWNNEQYVNFRTKIHYYAAKAKESYDKPASEGVDASVTAWQAIFGAGFVKPPEKKALAKASEALLLEASDRDETPVLDRGEEDITEDRGFPIDFSDGYRVKVRGRVRGKAGMDTYDLSKRGSRVGKRRNIAFDVVECSVPEPYDIYWKVKNYGEEAEREDCLRGNIVAGNKYWSEPTAYRGNHYVEVYVVKDGRCVATNRQRVTVL